MTAKPMSQDPKTRGKAIAQYCKWCLFDPKEPGNWRQQITACTATDCPLYRFRPRSKPKTTRPSAQSGIG